MVSAQWATPRISSNTLFWLIIIFLPLGLSEGQCVRKQPPNILWLEDSNYSQYQGNLHRGMCSWHRLFRVPLANVPATPGWGGGGKWTTFWREYKSRTIRPTTWNLGVGITYKLKLMCTKYEVIRSKHVEGISIYLGDFVWVNQMF